MNKKKKIFPAIVFICAFACYGFASVFFSTDRKVPSSCLFENIEALASEESGNGRYFCYGSGTVDCPDGSKAEYVADNFSLFDDE